MPHRTLAPDGAILVDGQSPGPPINVALPEMETSVQFPAGTSPEEIQNELAVAGAFSRQTSPLAGILSAFNSVVNQPQSTLPGFSGGDVAGLTSQQVTDVSRTIQRSNESRQQQGQFDMAQAERQKARTLAEIEREKQRQQDIKLLQLRQKNAEDLAKFRSNLGLEADAVKRERDELEVKRLGNDLVRMKADGSGFEKVFESDPDPTNPQRTLSGGFITDNPGQQPGRFIESIDPVTGESSVTFETIPGAPVNPQRTSGARPPGFQQVDLFDPVTNRNVPGFFDPATGEVKRSPIANGLTLAPTGSSSRNTKIPDLFDFVVQDTKSAISLGSSTERRRPGALTRPEAMRSIDAARRQFGDEVLRGRTPEEAASDIVQRATRDFSEPAPAAQREGFPSDGDPDGTVYSVPSSQQHPNGGTYTKQNGRWFFEAGSQLRLRNPR